MTVTWPNSGPMAEWMTMIARLALGISSVLLMTCVALMPLRAEVAKPLPPADPIWAASFKDTSGQLQRLDQFKGKVTVFYFWAVWCESCQLEAPRMSALQQKYKDKGLAVVGVAIDNADTVRAFVEKNKLTNPNVYGGKDAMQLMKELGNSMGAVPFLVVIGRDGNIIKSKLGDAPDDTIEGLVASLVG